MDFKRVTAFFLIIVLALGVVAYTSPGILKDVRLGLDLKGGFEVLYHVEPLEKGQKLTKDGLIAAAESIAKRANKSGVEEPEVTPEGKDRIRARIAGVKNAEEVRKNLREPAVLTFRSNDGKKIELNGTDFKENGAKVEYDRNQQPIIAIKLKDKAKFTEITTRLSQLSPPQNVLAIYMDDEIISTPSVNEPIASDSATITGSFTYDEAKKLADTINLGALPVKLTEKYSQSVGASLGKESLHKTIEAGIIASIMIVLFMLIFYRLPGFVASVTIITYSWLLLVVFNWMNATLTLPGIAAFVLNIGMAVDANIIMYERIKEEIRSGKSLLSALRSGSKNSFRTILDANLTTILAGVVLYYMGTGAIQGFALTLIFGIVVSFVTNVFFSRLLLHLMIRGKLGSKPAYFGVKEADIREL